MKKKFAAALASAIILLAVFTSVLSAVDYEDFDEEYEEMLDGIPEDIRELLPDGIFSEDPEEIYGAVSEISGFPYIIRTVASLLGIRLGSALRLFALLLGLLVLSALLRSVRELIKSPALSQAVSLCSISAILAAVVSVQYEMLSAVLRFLDQLNLLVNSMIPIMGALYAMGGNVSAAVANNSAMMVFLTVTENICNRTVIPVTAFCLALSLVSAFAPALNLKGIAAAIKRIFTFIIAFVMTLLGTVLAMQSTLTAAGDSVAARAARFMAGNFIPVVGGSVGESLKTVAGSIEFIRACVGVGGIIIIILLLLPTILSIVATRLAFMAAGTVSKLLGCSEESNLLGELTQIYGYLLAVVCSCSVLFIFALTLLARTSAAIG
ncbi:MAG: stage III sporulation protein AE [Eubacteriales bacterium]|jgi:stage III sporulation protein AE